VNTDPLTLIEKYGSFGLVCVIFAWVALYLTPKVLELINNQRKEFLDALEAGREHTRVVVARTIRKELKRTDNERRQRHELQAGRAPADGPGEVCPEVR
jgi:hypothetical protein